MADISIRDIVAYGHYGVSDEERATKQPITASVTITVDSLKAEQDDNIDSTVSWADIRKKIIKIIEGSSYNLIERLASEMVNELLEDSRIQSVTLKLEKPEAFDTGIPGIILSKVRD